MNKNRIQFDQNRKKLVLDNKDTKNSPFCSINSNRPVMTITGANKEEILWN